MRARPAPARDLVPRDAVPTSPVGGFVEMDGETHYRIAAYDRMAPFFMSVPSDADLWMFVASGGGLTAGRVDADGALFPYRTVDQLHEARFHTGPVTLIRCGQPGQDSVLWEPFAPVTGPDVRPERILYKNVVGNRVVFEEINRDLGLVFRYAWSACDRFGWVRTATLENIGGEAVHAAVLDGLRNILPHGAPLGLYQQSSNLVDAYKMSEIDAETGLGLFSLSAGITDKAEAVEVLRTNVVWSRGLEGARLHLDDDVVEGFRKGRVIRTDPRLNGCRGNYLVSARLELAPGTATDWHFGADTGRDHLQVAELRRFLRENPEPGDIIAAELDAATGRLRDNVGSADGLQLTARDEAWAHHFANVLFNNMRGGVFQSNYDIPVADLVDFLDVRHTGVAARQGDLLAEMPATVTVDDLLRRARETGDADFVRLCLEYLPLHFGRRHGDPSRPWNRFEIRVREADGSDALHYEGNWRDIFQNWEALATAFPGFLPGMVAKFVNASTVDGFNPYRIDRDGVDWEVVEEDDPWANIGYWGDHQVIYLLKLLEAWHAHDPAALAARFDEAVFSYADVPYRIKPYAEILDDPSDTITFDHEKARHIESRVDGRGTDGKLVTDADGAVHHANLLEKLLVPALAKLSNLIPDAGIWMNTQRPEWNDANNALAGGGVSVVTLAYLRRYLVFLGERLAEVQAGTLPVAEHVIGWFDGVADALAAGRSDLQGTEMTPARRKALLDRLGTAFCTYRATAYEAGPGQPQPLALDRVRAFVVTALEYVEWGLRANRRADGLSHTYNVATVDAEGVRIDRLPEMLEGQVALLSAGVLSPAESLELLERLFASDLYRPSQRSFMLYPERTLPGFLERNAVPATAVAGSSLVRELEERGDTSLLARDADGVFRFQGDLRHAADVEAVLDRLALRPELAGPVARDRTFVLGLFEETFNHRSFTGRSGTMYGYEGLGCIYWHMVAKLLLAVQEAADRAAAAGGDTAVSDGLDRMYHLVRAGIGYEKSVAEYGAFPTDPYSHTPPDGGAKQPGMTGQVKEEILTRRGELGIRVHDGLVRFAPRLLARDEFLTEPRRFAYRDTAGVGHTLALPQDSLVFTLCQVPVVYQLEDDEPRIRVEYADGSSIELADDTLDAGASRDIFARNSRIVGIRVGVRADDLHRN